MSNRTLSSTLRWSEASDYFAVTATSAQSAAVPANCYEIRYVATVATHINIGAAPTAVATDNNGFYVPLGVVEYFHVTPGQQLAAIRAGADDGTVSIAFMTR
jgi:hypothetical protein